MCCSLTTGRQTKPKLSSICPFKVIACLGLLWITSLKVSQGRVSACHNLGKRRSLVIKVGPPQLIKNYFILPGLQIREIDLSSLPWELPSNLGLVSLGLASPVSQTRPLLHEGLPSPITRVGGHLRWFLASWTSFCEHRGDPQNDPFGDTKEWGRVCPFLGFYTLSLLVPVYFLQVFW